MNIKRLAKFLVIPAALAGVLTVSAFAAEATTTEDTENTSAEDTTTVGDLAWDGTMKGTGTFELMEAGNPFPKFIFNVPDATTLGDYTTIENVGIYWGQQESVGEAKDAFNFKALDGTNGKIFDGNDSKPSEAVSDNGIAYWQNVGDNKIAVNAADPIALTLKLVGSFGDNETSAKPFYVRGAVAAKNDDSDTKYFLTSLLQVVLNTNGSYTISVVSEDPTLEGDAEVSSTGNYADSGWTWSDTDFQGPEEVYPVLNDTSASGGTTTEG